MSVAVTERKRREDSRPAMSNIVLARLTVFNTIFGLHWPRFWISGESSPDETAATAR